MQAALSSDSEKREALRASLIRDRDRRLSSAPVEEHLIAERAYAKSRARGSVAGRARGLARGRGGAQGGGFG